MPKPNVVRIALRLILLATLAASSAQAQIGDFFARMTNPSIVVDVEHPPKHWLEVERIAFAETRGQCAEEVVALLREDFVQRGVTVVDRAHLETVLAEHGLVLGRLVSEETAIEMGKILGATTLISLDVQRCEDEPKTWRKRYEKKNGGYSVSYYASNAMYIKGSVQVVDLETTQIFSAEVFNVTEINEVGPKSDYIEPPSIFPIKDVALDLAALEVVKLLFTWREGVELLMFDSKKCGLKDVYRRVEVGDYDGAESLAQAAVDSCDSRSEKHQARAHYNLGMTQLLKEDFESAETSFDTAYRIDPSNDIRDAIQNTRQAAQAQQRLRSYYSFLAGSEIDARAELARHALDAALSEPTAQHASPGDSIAERLRQLESLRDQGLLSEDEYDSKRQQILDEL